MAEQVIGERMARMVLSLIAEPDDSVTGHILARFGGVETLRLVDSDDAIPDLGRADAMVWREHPRRGGRHHNLPCRARDRGRVHRGRHRSREAEEEFYQNFDPETGEVR